RYLVCRPFPCGPPPNPADTFRCTRLSSDLCRACGGLPVVDGLVAGWADHEGLAPLPGHEGRPGRLGRARWSELGAAMDLVHLHRAGLLVQFAAALAEPGGQLLEGVGHRFGDAVDERRVLASYQGYPAEPGDQWLPAVAFLTGLEAGPFAVRGFGDRLVLGR